MLKNFEEQFIHYCKSVNFEINQNQIEVIKKLQNYFEKNFKSSFLKFFSKEFNKKSFYLYGDVGVGNTMILNFFFNMIKKKKKKTSF